MEIKTLTKKYIKDVIRIIKIAFGEKEAEAARSWFYLSKKLESTVLHSQKRFVVIENSKVVGTCGIYSWRQHPKDITWLGWFTVLPKYRKKGIGSKLFTHTIRYAIKKGYRLFCIETTSHKSQRNAIRLYRKFGFEKSGQISNFWKNHDIVFLSKKLK